MVALCFAVNDAFSTCALIVRNDVLLSIGLSCHYLRGDAAMASWHQAICGSKPVSVAQAAWGSEPEAASGLFAMASPTVEYNVVLGSF